MHDRFDFDRVARVPAAEDNVAIATRRLEAGTVVADGTNELRLPHTILEGHRFVRAPIPQGAHLTSWGLPFGIAARALGPGEYVCNGKILAALAERDIDFELPAAANFLDTVETCTLDEASFTPGRQIERADSGATFHGFRRPGGRGVGTRNFVVVLATTSRANGFVRQVAERAAALARPGLEAPGSDGSGLDDPGFDGPRFDGPRFDGIVAVTHTEGGGIGRPNNLDHVLRVLAGFMVHPNVGAVLAADDGAGAYGNADLRRFMEDRRYPLGTRAACLLPHRAGIRGGRRAGGGPRRTLAARGRRRPPAPGSPPARFVSLSSAGAPMRSPASPETSSPARSRRK